MAEPEMEVGRVRRSSSWRVALVSAMSVAVVAASALGSAGSPGSPASIAGASTSSRTVVQRTALCASAATLTRLGIRRSDAFPKDHFRFSFPSSVVVRDEESVRRVARALCSLPVPTSHTMLCPADFGIEYHLRFSRAHRHFRSVTLDATGCQTVSGLVRPRWIARSPRFWRELGVAMRLKAPSWKTFRGASTA